MPTTDEILMDSGEVKQYCYYSSRPFGSGIVHAVERMQTTQDRT
jgi:hypothetical protein